MRLKDGTRRTLENCQGRVAHLDREEWHGLLFLALRGGHSLNGRFELTYEPAPLSAEHAAEFAGHVEAGLQALIAESRDEQSVEALIFGEGGVAAVRHAVRFLRGEVNTIRG